MDMIPARGEYFVFNGVRYYDDVLPTIAHVWHLRRKCLSPLSSSYMVLSLLTFQTGAAHCRWCAHVSVHGTRNHRDEEWFQNPEKGGGARNCGRIPESPSLDMEYPALELIP